MLTVARGSYGRAASTLTAEPSLHPTVGEP